VEENFHIRAKVLITTMVKAQTCGDDPQHRATKSFRDKGESSPILQIPVEGYDRQMGRCAF
jgi:hypothetical protein